MDVADSRRKEYGFVFSKTRSHMCIRSAILQQSAALSVMHSRMPRTNNRSCNVDDDTVA